MKKEIKILIIDDHQLIIDGYKNAILSQNTFFPKIKSANNCDEAIFLLQNSKIEGVFDLVLIDIQIPASKDMKFTSGEDIALYIKKHFSYTKIVFLTMIDKAFRLENIINSIPHHGILIKSDVNKNILNKAFIDILNGELFYSKSVSKIANRIIKKNDILDDKDVKIIYYLSKGIKTKQIPIYLHLSLSAIEKRKKNLKLYFDAKNDEELLIEAKKNGFL